MSHSIRLQSYPEYNVKVPPQTNVFFPRSPAPYDTLDRNELVSYCKKEIHTAIAIGEKKHQKNIKSILLILPDKTRSQVAARILIDAILNIVNNKPELKVTLLYGLGTHPLMSLKEIEKLIGKERYSKLQAIGIAIKQQTTKIKTNELVEIIINPHSFQEIANKSETAPYSRQKNSTRYSVKIPQLLFNHHLTLIAGDTKIHPYEGRYGSGGINKMLAVGIASLNEIRRSHSTSVLLATTARAGDPTSPFIKMIDTTAEGIQQAMISRPESQAMSVPYGFTVLAQDEDQIWEAAFGDHENYRQELAQNNYHSHVFYVDTTFNLVISDIEPKRGTDILAGARALQYICDWNEESAPLLKPPNQNSVALLYNPCNEPLNNSGIGNDGTKEQLDILLEMTQEHRDLIKGQLLKATSWQEIEKILRISRDDLLKQWQLHLQVVSEADQIWLQLEKLAKKVLADRSKGVFDYTIEQSLHKMLFKYAGKYNVTMKIISQLLQQYEQGHDFRGIIDQINSQVFAHQEHFGLGEGGQRALRLLKICQHFKYFFIATFNPVVISYIHQLNPDLTEYISPSLQDQSNFKSRSITLLGIQTIDLNTCSPQIALDIAYHYSASFESSAKGIEIAYLKKPVILRRNLNFVPKRE